MQIHPDTISEVFAPVRSELAAVHRASDVMRLLTDSHRCKVREFLDLPPFEMCFRPAVVVLLGRLYGGAWRDVVSLAAMVQLVFLGMRTHQRMGEDGPDSGELDRLAVLLGDYYFCRFFALGASAGLMRCVRPLTEVVYRYAEDSVPLVPTTTPEQTRRRVRLETAALTAEACRMAGEVAGAGGEEQRRLYELGADLGMGCGLIDRGLAGEGRQYLETARRRLAELPAGEARDALDTLIVLLLKRTAQPAAEVQGLRNRVPE